VAELAEVSEGDIGLNHVSDSPGVSSGGPGRLLGDGVRAVAAVAACYAAEAAGGAGAGVGGGGG
jgi:hypothetical protein